MTSAGEVLRTEFFVVTDMPCDKRTGRVFYRCGVPDDAGRMIHYPLAGPFGTEEDARRALEHIRLPENALCDLGITENRYFR